MNVHDGLKTIFIHNPRAAGSAIEIALGLDHGHDTVDQSKVRHGEKWETYFTFALARNPLDRLISTYEFAKMERSWYHDNASPGPVGAHGDAHVDYETVKGKSLEDCCRMLLADPESLKQPGWKPQTHFIPDPTELDFVGRYENLSADWRHICRKLGVEIELSRINETDRLKNRLEYHTPLVCEACARIYRSDYVTFGYSLPLPMLPDAPPDPKAVEPMTAGKLVHGAVGIAKAVTGIGRASDEAIAKRTAICEGCKNWVKVPLGHKCVACGCSGLKLLNADEKCPIGLWTVE